MTKTGALNHFWSSFGLPAYDEASVPTGKDAPAFPYITYQVVTDSFGSAVSLTGSVWYRSSSWTEANAKVQQISARLTSGGIFVVCDGGAIWLRRGAPFAQSMGDSSDDMIKRKVIAITAEFLTND